MKEPEHMNGYGYTGDLTNANGEFGLRGLTPGRYAVFPIAEAAKEYYSDPTIFEVTDHDVEALEVKAYRGAVISGTVVIEEATDAAILKLLSRVIINARVEAKTLQAPGNPASVNPDGSFRLTGLRPGKARLSTHISDGEGAAELRGRVEGKNLPARLRVHLVPADDDVLRYAEVVTPDGAFTFTNLAPGKYWLLARAVPDDESDEKPAKPVAWAANERAKLRQTAEAANQAITLMACQRAKEFVLKFEAAVK